MPQDKHNGQRPVDVQNGRNGGRRIADTTQFKGQTFEAIYCEADTVISSLTGNFTGATSVTLPAGTCIFGLFTQITLTSGTVHIYYS